MLHRPRTPHLTPWILGGDIPDLFRRDQPSLVTGAYSDGNRHAPEVAEGWIHGKARPLSDRSWGTPGGHRLTGDCESGAGWSGKATPSPVPTAHETRQTRQSAPDPLL